MSVELIEEARRPMTNLDVTADPRQTRYFILRLADALERHALQEAGLRDDVARLEAAIREALTKLAPHNEGARILANALKREEK